jgi:hypothetical protein
MQKDSVSELSGIHFIQSAVGERWLALFGRLASIFNPTGHTAATTPD